jgi:hypothetical protein
VLDVREFLGAAVLAPALRHAVPVEHQSGVGAIGAHPVLLDGAMADPPLPALRVIADAPADPVDPVVALNEVGEGIPRRGIELANRVPHRRSAVVPRAPVMTRPHRGILPAMGADLPASQGTERAVNLI